MLNSSPLPSFRRIALAAVCLGAFVAARAEPLISEFMASNATTLADENGDFSDWIEIYNPDATPANLAGWYLTDDAKKKTQWQFPAVTVPARGFLVVFADNKDRRDPTQPLHTNFKLDADGGYLALIRPDGTNAATEFAAYPAQPADVSYGVAQPTSGGTGETGLLRNATPGEANDPMVMLGTEVSFSRGPGLFSGSFSLTLSGAGPGEHIRYVTAEPSSDGAAVEAPTAASTEYTGPISITSSVIVRAATFSADDKTSGRPVTAQFLHLDPSLAGFSTRLPVVILDNHGFGELGKDSIDHPSWVYAYEPTNGAVFSSAPELSTPGTMSVRGNFSANFAKSSFNVNLLTDLGRDNPQPLLGLDSAKQWALVGPWLTDRSYIRNAFVYALSNRIGRWAPRTRFVEAFVNTDGGDLTAADYWGIMVLTDSLKVSKNRIDITPLSPTDVSTNAITGGYVVKFDPVPDPTHYNFVTDRGIPVAGNDTTAVVIDTPKASDLNPAQREYIRGYVQQMENSLFAAADTGFANRAYLDYIDVPSWVDHHILEVFTGNVDALYHSEYFTKDRGGKLVSGPVWDFDGSMGNGDPRDERWDVWDLTGGRGVWTYGWWAPLSQDSEFIQAWVDRWQALRRNEFSAVNLRALADSLAADVGGDAAARDAARWSDNESRFPGGFLGEVAHLKDWIVNRANWIDQQFVGPPTATASGSSVHLVPASGAQLVYTLDGSDPRSRGGAIAPGALMSSAPVDVPASGNIHARSYRADLAGVVPESPWSSATEAGNASPLTPVARLVNLSTRGRVGTDENALIAGVVVADTASKRYVARGIGPGLTAFGTTGVLSDPRLIVYRQNGTEIDRNTRWETSPDAAVLPARFKSVGAFPLATGSADSALMTQVGSGAYTLNLGSASAQSGVGLAELYELDGNGRTVNLSTRGFVGSGADVLIGGFVVQGPAYKRVLIRGIGPTLHAFGVIDALADSEVTLYSGATVMASNDRWTANANAAALRVAAKAVGAFDLPENSEDAALLVTVPPGAYTVIVNGKGNDQGVGLLEIYEVP